uniref:Iodothyronine deiodinase n=1 Tax=Molossus molossus TaxID=27622 RepID=A0A7J8F904_MOLMO|nr:hypothetical protein HJG59_008549 [Molossus molossus]
MEEMVQRKGGEVSASPEEYTLAGCGRTSNCDWKYGWAFKNNVVIRNHQNLQDRLQAAHLLLDRRPQCPVVVDTMKNQSSQLYAALPDRLYVLQEGRILYKGKPGPWNYHPEEVRAVLEKLHS